ncbi:MAG: metal ABC transporter permease [Epulopiscium sp.]|nr:metal ABC transporter permease [Candidatus Epulonipiscium sp.]
MDMLQLMFTDHTLRVVSLGSILLGIISGVLGSFAVIKKQSLLGDAISHAALPGIALVFLLTNSKKTEVLLLGALVSGLLATFIILSIVRNSRIKFDSALALILSVFFGGGLVLLTYIQKTPNANQAGLDKFIFGQASTLLKRDVTLMGVMGVILIGMVILFWKEFKITAFDAEFAQSLGFSVTKINIILSAMIVAAIIIGLQTVGVILMSAMLIAPAVAARQWTDNFSIMVFLSALFGALSGFIGTLISSMAEKLPTGPTIVLVISMIVFISLTLAPNRGLVWKHFRDLKNHKGINEDKILSDLYYICSTHGYELKGHEVAGISPTMAAKSGGLKELTKKLKALKMRGLAFEVEEGHWSITEKGIEYMKKHFIKEEM